MSSLATRSPMDAFIAASRDRTDISARSMLMTILGDTVAPLGGSIWLADLIELATSFGYNDRLVRTSMFRLAAEGWVTNERVGRRSRYSLTEFSRREISDAAARIYRRSALPWDGEWTLVFLGDVDDELEQHLRWHGFAAVTTTVYAKPNADIDGARVLLDRLDVDPQPMVATATFDEAGPTGATTFRDASGLARTEAAYREFVERYGWTESLTPGELAPNDAFLLRTMLVHDLRRSRLSDPELPAALLPADWIGRRAMATASSVYHAIDHAAWRWAESITGVAPDPDDPQLAQRFAPPSTPSASASRPPRTSRRQENP